MVVGGGGGLTKAVRPRERNTTGSGVLSAARASRSPVMTCGRPYSIGEEEGGSPAGKC
jgi:hypothetical protein